MTIPETEPSNATFAERVDDAQSDAGAALDRRLLTLIAGGEPTSVIASGPSAGATRGRGPQHRQFLDALGVATYTTDADGRITFFNAAAAEFWGRSPELGEEWCGSVRLLHTDGSPMRHDECPMAIALKERRVVRGGEAIAVRPDGSRVRFMAYPSPLFDEAGTMVGAVNVLVDVTERRRAEEATLVTARALAASNAVKDEFLGLVSHELRTPVTTIYGNALLLQARGVELGDATRDSMLADMVADADRLHSIIENLLHLTRLGSGSELDLEPQVFERVVERSIQSYAARHPDRDVRFKKIVTTVLVEADETYLDLLIENLLNNADKYSDSREPIDVELSVTEFEVALAIRDRGIGFGDVAPETLFEPFYRSREAREAASGLGIGLALCKRVVDVLGGRIWAKPREGGGADISFALPILPVAQEPY